MIPVQPSKRIAIGALLALALPVASLFAATAPAGAQSSGTPIEKTVTVTQPATVRLQMDWHAYVNTGPADFGRIGPFDFSSSCTGFVVDPSGYIVTAGHCLDSSLEGIGGDVLQEILQELVAAGYLTPSQAASDSTVSYVVGNWTIEGEAAKSPADVEVTVGHGIGLSGKEGVEGQRARVIEVNPASKGDVALVKVEARDMPTLQLADGGDPAVGTAVLSVGYPASSDKAVDATMTATFKDGKVSSKKTRAGGALPAYEVSAAMSPGMSGGPTVTEDAKVIGLNSFYPSGENQQFNFLSPVSLIRETLSRNGVKNAPGPIDQVYREAVDAYYSGNLQGAGQKLDQVLQRVPSHQQAQELRSKVAEKQASSPVAASTTAMPAIETKPAESSNAALFAGIGILAVVIIGGLVTVLVLNGRRRNGPTAPPAGGFHPGGSAPMGSSPDPAGPSQMGSYTIPTPVVPGAAVYRPPHAGRTNGSMGAERPAPVTAPAATAVSQRFCSNCGQQAKDAGPFCATCGHELHG